MTLLNQNREREPVVHRRESSQDGGSEVGSIIQSMAERIYRAKFLKFMSSRFRSPTPRMFPFIQSLIDLLRSLNPQYRPPPLVPSPPKIKYHLVPLSSRGYLLPPLAWPVLSSRRNKFTNLRSKKLSQTAFHASAPPRTALCLPRACTTCASSVLRPP